MSRNVIRPFLPGLVLLACTFSMGQSGPFVVGPSAQPAANSNSLPPLPASNVIPDLDKRPKMSDLTRMQLIGVINAELVRVRKICPVGFKNMVLTPEGEVKPDDARLYRMAMTNGAAAKIGDKVQITNVVFKDKAVYIEINGGPKKKSKWYDHVSIGGMGGNTGGGQVDPNQGQATGTAITLEFKDHLPEINGQELKQLLQPILDFTVRTAAEVYVDTLPPKVREAVKHHEILVGMNRDMVIAARERPPQKVREKDEKGNDVEEWIYGAAPQDVLFIRFTGDEVTQVKIMRMGGEKIVKTEKEVDVTEGVVSMASIARQGESPSANAEDTKALAKPAQRPTLRRPDEAPDDAVHQGAGVSVPEHKDGTPQWGSDGQEQPPINTKPPLERWADDKGSGGLN